MDLFRHNLDALARHNPDLAKRLESIGELSRFEAFSTTPDNPKSINIRDHANDRFLYSDPEVDLGLKLALEASKYEEPYLYCYGIGNGALAYMLLQSNALLRLVVVEGHDELLYIALNLFDLAEPLATQRLQLFAPSELNSERATKLLDSTDALAQRNRFELLSAGSYYTDLHAAEMQELEQRLKTALDTNVMLLGNDLGDSLKGLKQSLGNIPRMLQGIPFQSLKETKPSKTAIIVSTGPSLQKQLPLLKEAAPYATLISVDASLPILEAHGIKPDFCVTMERDEPTAEFFKRTSPAFQRGILFLCASVQHPDLFNALEGQKTITYLRRNLENRFFGLDDYGYLGYGHSSANFAHDLAYELGAEQAVLIGQDLAFGDDGKTHAKGHLFDSNPSIEQQIREKRLFEIEKYGGGGTVTTHVFWKLFLDAFTEAIARFEKRMQTINATEGGARIPGTVERPFAEVVTALKSSGTAKTVLTLKLPAAKKQATLLAAYRKQLRIIYNEIARFKQNLETTLATLTPVALHTSTLIGAQKKGKLPPQSLNTATDRITEMRRYIDTEPAVAQFLMPLLMPNIMELEIACQDVRFTHSDDPELRAVRFIETNQSLFQNLYTHLLKLETTIEPTLKELM